MVSTAAKKADAPFDPKAFLAAVNHDRTVAKYRKGNVIFHQGDPAEAIFYVQKGRVKIVVVSKLGNEAVIALLGAGDFFGEGCLIGQPLRLATAQAMADRR